VSEARFPTGGVESGGVHVVVDASLRTVTLARPAKRNALNAAMLNGLREAFGSQPSDEERVAVIRAEGPVFCAGLDLTERAGGGSISIESVLDAAGPAVAREILMLGDPVPAARLGELGIIARVASPDAFEAAVDSVVSRLAENAPFSLRAIKATLSRAMEFRSGLVHDEVDELIGRAVSSADAREGMQARLQKRTPRFTGR